MEFTKEDYKNAVEELVKAHEKERLKLDRKYAFCNNKYRLGDIIEDHVGKGRVDEIRFVRAVGGRLPECVYIVTELKKDGTPKKSGATRKIYQCNIKK